MARKTETRSTSAGDAVDVTVALLPPFPFVFSVDGDIPEHNTPWPELPKAQVLARPQDSLRDVLRQACKRLGVTLNPEAFVTEPTTRNGSPLSREDAADKLVFVAFRQDDDDVVIADDGFGPILKRESRTNATVLVVRDQHGHAVWRRPPFDASMAELIDAHDAGLLEGDPLQVYLIPSIPQGDLGLLGQWHDFNQVLNVLWEVTDAAATLGGAWGLALGLKEVRQRRSRKAADTVRRLAPTWSKRGAAPVDLIRLLAARPRKSREIAILLGCSLDEAEAILWALGFSHDASINCWRFRGDAAAQLIADDIDLSMHGMFGFPKRRRRRYRKLARERLESFATDGQVPSLQEEEERLTEELFADADIPLRHRLWDRIRHRR